MSTLIHFARKSRFPDNCIKKYSINTEKILKKILEKYPNFGNLFLVKSEFFLDFIRMQTDNKILNAAEI